MIFVTLGTSDYPFTRLLKQMDDLIENNIVKNIIVQCGNEDYQPKNFTIIKNLDKKEFNEYLKKAEVVITHGGVGTIIDCIKMGKKVIAFPRKAEYGEATNNHQATKTHGRISQQCDEYIYKQFKKYGFNTYWRD